MQLLLMKTILPFNKDHPMRIKLHLRPTGKSKILPINYGITKGTLLEYMDTISSWAKECIQKERVFKLE